MASSKLNVGRPNLECPMSTKSGYWQSIALENLNGNRTVPLVEKLSKVIFVNQQVWFWVAGWWEEQESSELERGARRRSRSIPGEVGKKGTTMSRVESACSGRKTGTTG